MFKFFLEGPSTGQEKECSSRLEFSVIGIFQNLYRVANSVLHTTTVRPHQHYCRVKIKTADIPLHLGRDTADMIKDKYLFSIISYYNVGVRETTTE